VSFLRKPIRLDPSNYRGKRAYFVTICCQKRLPAFANYPDASWLVTELIACAANQNFFLHAYCVMPDQVHFLAEGAQDRCDLVQFVSVLKQQSGFAFRGKYGRPLWQARYYDYILRKPDATDAIAWYIWMNPVRRGLCSLPHEYPFSGSLTVDWKQRASSEIVPRLVET
jgi:REP-associated tyrosine transposase